MKKLLAFLAVLISVPALADGDVPDYVLKDLAPGVHRVEHSIYTYHYVNPASMGLPADFSMNDPRVVQHIRINADYYWDRSQDAPKDVDVDHLKTVPGIGGLYAAIDPGSSQAWAKDGKAFLAYRIELPQGFAYLDVTAHGVDQLSEKTRAYLKTAGCQAERFSQLFWWNLGSSCREIATQALRTLDVDAIKYPFAAERICKGDGRIDPSAFIIVKADHIPASGVRIFNFDPSQDSDGGAERRILRAISANENTGLVSSDLSQIPTGTGHFDLDGAQFPGQSDLATCGEVLRYEKEHLLNCLPQ